MVPVEVKDLVLEEVEKQVEKIKVYYDKELAKLNKKVSDAFKEIKILKEGDNI